MASAVGDIFLQAASLNREDEGRKGSTVWRDWPGRVIVAGDLHGNRAALGKIIAHADLAATGERQTLLVLQEIIHGPPDPASGMDRSIDLMLRAARLKISSPHQVILLLGNHDVAQITGNEITKDGRGVCKAFADSLSANYGQQGPEILQAVCEFCRSMPLALRLGNGTFITHSLPTPNRMAMAGLDILDRPADDQDLRRGHSVYEWTWGRGQTPQQIDELAGQLGVSFFVLGHRHIPAGYEFIGPRALTLTSEHALGHVLEFDGSVPLTEQTAQAGLKLINTL